MSRKKVIIVGAGAKAAAIVARAAVMTELKNELGIPGAPEIVVIEKDRPGAAWVHTSGYTDGDVVLCTPPEMDVGFPYLSDNWDDETCGS